MNQGRIRLSVFLILLSVLVAGSIADAYPRLEPSLELDQILSTRFGLEYRFTQNLGVRGTVGFSVSGFPLTSYSATAVYHSRAPERVFQLDAEAGLLLSYFNFFEGECIDWDPVIDDPFAGWLYGGALVWGYRWNNRQISLQTGIAAWWEWQRDSGWKGPGIMPIASLRYGWHL